MTPSKAMQKRKYSSKMNTADSSYQLSETSSSRASSFSSRRESLIKMKQGIFSMIVSIEDKTPKTGLKNYIYILLLNIHVILGSLGIGMLGAYHWGEYGNWVWTIFNYLITLSIDRVPYEGLIVFEVVFVCFSLLGLVIFIQTAKSVGMANRNMKLLRNCIFYYGHVQFFSCLIGTFVMTSFLDCDYESQVAFENYDDLQNVLVRAPNVMCQSVTSICLMVIGIIGILISIANTVIYGQILGNTHLKNTAPFIMDTPFFFSMFLGVSQLQILLNYAIPNQYMYGRSVLHIVMSLVLIPCLFYFLPYFVRVENSIWSGILFAKVLSPIGSLISFMMNGSNAWDLGLGFTFIPIALILVGFLLGFIAMEVYIRWFYHSIRKEMLIVLENCHEQAVLDTTGANTNTNGVTLENLLAYFEKDAYSLFKNFVEQKKLNRLGVFLKFTILSKMTTSTTYGINDRQLAISFIKSVAQHKSFVEPDLIFSSALITSYVWEDGSHEYSLGLLRRINQRKLNFFSGLTLLERLKEIETSLYKSSSSGSKSDHSHGGISMVDVKHILAKLDKQYDAILDLHKAIWKELFNVEINYTNLMELNRKTTDLTYNTVNTFENLMKDFRNEKNVLRMYGKFLENILFNKLRANELYQEANDIENEEAQKENKTLFPKGSFLKGSVRANKIVPLKETVTNQNENSRASINSRSSLSKSTSSLAFKFKKMEKSKLDGLDNGYCKEFVEHDVDNKMGSEASEDPQMKKEMLYRSALSTPSDNKFIYSCLFLSISIFLLLFISGFSFSIASLVHSTSDVKLIKISCMPSITTLSMQLDIRMQQLLLTLYNNQTSFMPQSLIEAGAANFSMEHKESISIVLKSLQELQNSALDELMSDDMFHEFSESTVPFKNPVIDKHPGEFTGSKQSNTSISSITNTLIQFLKEFQTYSPQQYNNTLSNYKVMYFWHNRDLISSAFEEFCTNIVDRSYDTVRDTNSAFMYFYFCCLGLLVITCCLLLICNLLIMRSLKSVFKLIERTIPKDAIGKIYHQMAMRYAENGEGSHKSNFSRNPKIRASLFTILIFFTTTLCMSMFFYEVLVTSEKTERIMRNVERSAAISVDAHDITGKIGEVLIFSILPYDKFAINSHKLLDQKEVVAYHESVYEIKKKISKEWNLLLYGDITTNDQPLIGLFSEVDNHINGAYCANSSSTTTSCTSLNDKVHELYLQSIIMNERYNDKDKDMYKIFPEFFIGLYTDCKILAHEFEAFMNIYVSSIERDNSSTIVIIFGVLGALIIPLFGYLLVSSYDKHVNEVQTVRMLLNYIKIDHLDAKDEMRNYILYHKLFTSSRGENSLNKKEAEDLKVKSILNSAVDGAVSCTNYTIEVYNPAAQRMFGKLPEDVVGKPLWTLFNSNCEETIKNLFEVKVVSDSSSSSAIAVSQPPPLPTLPSSSDKNSAVIRGETLDLECVRKNGTTFPARVSLSWTLFGGNRVITCFIRDITLENKQKSLLSEEKKNSEKLLRNVLPESVARQLKSGEKLIADKLPDITCFFSDMVGFTKLSSSLSANDVVLMLSTIVTGFDKLTDKYELEKIKTIGDAYFCVGGLMQASDHPERVLRFAIDTFGVIRDFNKLKMKDMLETSTFSSSEFNQVDIRVGINTGPVIAGVIGTKKFAYDLWGETINVGSRMESNSQPGRIHLSRSTYERVYDLNFEFEERKIEIKGTPTQTYFLSAKHHERSHISKAEQQEVINESMITSQIVEETNLERSNSIKV